MTSKRKHCTKEFKLATVRLLVQGKTPTSELARELGIKRTRLFKW